MIEFAIALIGRLKMTASNVKHEHTVFCPESCSARHNEMILALSACSEDGRKPADLGPLKVALYSHLQDGWNAQSNVPDALPEFRFPLVQWACVLGKTQALSWLLTKMKFKAFVTAERTGETGLHRALRLLHKVRSRDATPRSVHFICSNFSLIVDTMTEQDPLGLFLKDKVQGNSVFHMCALCISQQESVCSELDYYEYCMKILLQRVYTLQTMEKVPTEALQTALNSKNDRGETILHILARNNISINTVKYLLSDYRGVLKKLIKNTEKATPLDVARDREADLVEKVLASEGPGLEQLARNQPDLYQLYTQDQDQADHDEAITDNSNSVDSSTQSKVNEEDSGAGYSLRLSSFLHREGFYRTSSPRSCISDDEFSQDETARSPSILSTQSVHFPASLATNTESMPTSDSQSTNNSDSENVSQQNGEEQDSRVSVVLAENSVLISLQVRETDVDEGLSNCIVVPCEKSCTQDGVSVNLPATSNSCSHTVQIRASELQVEETGDAPAAARADTEESTCKARKDQPLAHENGVSSCLAKIIRQESDVASMLVARLQDKKEQNRVELRRAQRELIEKQSRESTATKNLQQLRTELENLSSQKENLDRRREELLEELKNTEGNIHRLQKQSLALQSRIDEQVQFVASTKVDCEKANEECVSLKRKLTEYSEALSDIGSPCDEVQAKKECLENDT